MSCTYNRLCSLLSHPTHYMLLCRCNGELFNVHPSYAGCFPASPIRAVYLWQRASSTTPVLWYRWDLLQHLYMQRQQLPRVSVDGTAAGLLLHMQQEGTWDSRISSDHHTKSLGVALNQFANSQLRLSSPTALGMKREGLVDCCGVCCHGHEEFLSKRGVMRVENGFPVLVAAADGSAGPAAQQAYRDACASTATAAAAAAAVAGDPAAPSVGATTSPSDAAATQAAATAAACAGMAPGADQGGGQRTAGPVLPTRRVPPGPLLQNPLLSHEPYAQPKAVHGVSIDGLLKVPSLANAGELGLVCAC